MSMMTISKGLRYKKRVIEQIRKIDNEISSYNSVIVSDNTMGKREVSIVDLIANRKILVEHLINVKLILMNAARPIQEEIFKLSELKTEISLYSRLNVNHGPVVNTWNSDNNALNYDAVIRKANRDQIVDELQKRIDEIQEKLDLFNFQNTISITEPTLVKC